MTVDHSRIASRSRVPAAWVAGAATIAVAVASAAPAVLPTVNGQVVAYLASLATMLLVLAACGLAVKRSVFGALLNGRNTYSLARLQMLLWTVLVLAALFAIAISRFWLGHEALAVNIPDELLAAMGISVASAAATPAVLSLKTASTASETQIEAASLRLGETVVPAGQVLTRPSPARASLRDLIEGDEVATAGLVDISKVQQLLVTLLLVTIYGAMLGQLFAAGLFKDGVTQLPVFNTSFLTLMAISHGGYLAYAGVSKPASSVPPLPSPPDRTGGIA